MTITVIHIIRYLKRNQFRGNSGYFVLDCSENFFLVKMYSKTSMTFSDRYCSHHSVNRVFSFWCVILSLGARLFRLYALCIILFWAHVCNIIICHYFYCYTPELTHLENKRVYNSVLHLKWVVGKSMCKHVSVYLKTF